MLVLKGVYWASEAETRRLKHPVTIAYDQYDIHVVRGASTRALKPEVAFYGTSGTTGQALSATDPAIASSLVSLTFTPLFKPEATTATTITGHGVQVDTTTGVVTGLPRTAGAPVVHNFVIEVGAVAKDSTAPGGQRTLTPLHIRVHVHDTAARCWLTPTPLTVRQGSPGQRFTVLAELGTTGETPPLICDITRMPGLTWTSASAALTVDTNGDLLVKTPGTDPVDVTVTLPAAWGGISATGQVIPVVGWDALPADQYQVALLAGPGAARLTEVPNVLLIAEGLTSQQQPDWDAIVADFVDDTTHGRARFPYDLFLSRDSINIWGVFFASREPGSSVLYELRATTQPTSGNFTDGGIVPAPILPSTTDPTWDLPRLLGQVGLPTRSDTPSSGDAAQQAAYTAKLTEWQTIFGSDRVDPAKATNALWGDWIGFWFRTLIDERDTALGIAFGNRPSFMRDEPDRAPTLHPLRTSRRELNKMLGKLNDAGTAIGHVWVPAPKTGALPGAGKDREHVIALVGGGRNGGVDSIRELISATISDDRLLMLAKVDTGFRYATVPNDLPRNPLWGNARMTADSRGTVIHELSHSFRLQDEYAEIALSLPTTRANDLLDQGNVEPEAELTTSGKLDGSKLRWRWPRIARAAVVSGAITNKSGTDYVIPLRAGQSARFKQDTVVFLRQRPLLQSPKATTTQTVAIGTTSEALTVLDVPDGVDQIVVRASAAFKPGDFTAIPPSEAIVFVPVPAPAYAAAASPPDTFAELAPRVVRDYISSTGAPLNRLAATACSSLPVATNPTTDPRAQLVNLPTNVDRWLFHAHWIGAFDGGVRYSCGVYHPSNRCMMNNHHDVTTTFCWVCAYVLVDAIDPALHGDLDAWYAPGYVEPSS